MGDLEVRLDLVGTAVFAIVTVVGVVVFSSTTNTLVVATDLTLFAIGIVAFLLGYWTAVQRSRVDEISVVELFLMMGNTSPSRVKRIMVWCLGAQVVIGVAGALARSSTDGKSGSVLAFGILVPMFGLGLNGRWVATYGVFSPRKLVEVPLPEGQVGQDTDHG